MAELTKLEMMAVSRPAAVMLEQAFQVHKDYVLKYKAGLVDETNSPRNSYKNWTEANEKINKIYDYILRGELARAAVILIEITNTCYSLADKSDAPESK